MILRSGNITYFILVFYFVIFLFTGMANYKLDNFPSQRPFFYIHIYLCLMHIALMICIFVIRSKRFRLRVIDLSIIIIFLNLFIIMFFNSVTESYKSEVIISLIHYVGTFALLQVCLHFKTGVALRSIILLSVTIFTVAASLSGFFLLLNTGLQYEIIGLTLTQNLWTFPRIHGFMGDPTSLGGLIGFLLILLFAEEGFKFKKILLLFLFVALIASGSRNAAVSLILSFIILMCIWKNFRKMRFIFSLLFIFFVLAAVFFVLVQIGYVEQFFSRGTSSSSENSRIFIWLNVLHSIEKFQFSDFLVGRGVGSLKESYRSGFNSILELLHDTGIFGVISIIIIFFLLYFKIRASEDGVFLVLFFYIIFFNQFIHWLFRDTYGFVTFGLVYLFVFSSLSKKSSYNFVGAEMSADR